MATGYTPWDLSPQKTEADALCTLLRHSSPRDHYPPDEQALDGYNAMKALYFEKAEAEIARQNKIMREVIEAIPDDLDIPEDQLLGILTTIRDLIEKG